MGNRITFWTGTSSNTRLFYLQWN